MKYSYPFLTTLSCVICLFTIAQPTIRQQKTIGGDKHDWFQAMERTKDGGYILGGYSESDLGFDKTEPNHGIKYDGYKLYDFWIVRMDSARNILWNKTIGSNGVDYFSDLKETDDGGFILAGYSSADMGGNKTEDSKGGNDYWVVKLDINGNIQWDKTIGSPSNDVLNSIDVTNDGGFVLGGISGSDIGGDKTENARGEGDYWIIKLNGLGDKEWDKTIGGALSEDLAIVRKAEGAGYIVGGISWSEISGDKTEKSRGASDLWVVKLNDTGAVEWNKTIGGNKYETKVSVQSTEDGGCIVGTTSISNKSGDKSSDSKGVGDYWIIKLGTSGNIEWDKTIGGKQDDQLTDIQQMTTGGYILAGYSNSNISGDKTEKKRGNEFFYSDYWIVRLNKIGNIMWDKTIGGDDDESVIVKVREIKVNRFAVCGFSWSGKTGDKNKPVKGKPDPLGIYGGDYWFVELKYNDTGNNILAGKTSIDNNTFVKKAFKVFPNPVKDVINIQSSEQLSVSLIDQTGKVLLTKIINGNDKINVSNLIPGIYFLKNNSTGEVEKILISR